MAEEYGLFSDEGCVEDGIWGLDEARARLAEYDPGNELEIRAICRDHEGEPADTCEQCHADDEDGAA